MRSADSVNSARRYSHSARAPHHNDVPTALLPPLPTTISAAQISQPKTDNEINFFLFLFFVLELHNLPNSKYYLLNSIQTSVWIQKFGIEQAMCAADCRLAASSETF